MKNLLSVLPILSAVRRAERKLNALATDRENVGIVVARVDASFSGTHLSQQRMVIFRNFTDMSRVHIVEKEVGMRSVPLPDDSALFLIIRLPHLTCGFLFRQRQRPYSVRGSMAAMENGWVEPEYSSFTAM